jgi:hypothetical protein
MLALNVTQSQWSREATDGFNSAVDRQNSLVARNVINRVENPADRCRIGKCSDNV